MASMIFSLMTFAVAIPSAVKVFNWLATLYKGSISLATPMCYALMFIFLFGIGGLTGLFLGALAVNVHVHNTYFVVAHFHYVMFGGAMVAFLGGLHYWWPKITGRMFSDFWGRVAALMIFVGFNLTFFPQFLLGTHGMPRRYYDYSVLADRYPEIATYNFLSSIGAAVLATGFSTMLIYLLASLFNGRRAVDNPWGGGSLEWQTSSPPPYYNFTSPPVFAYPYDYTHIHYDLEIHGYIRKDEG
jgi:cytochrome c oxidase subunit 1